MNVFIEILLVLSYTFLFLWVINKWRFIQESGIPSHWLSGLFLLKLGVGFILYIVYTEFYSVREEADIFKYFDDSLVVYNSLWKNPIDYLRLVFFKAPTADYFFDHYYVKMNHWSNPNDSIFYGDSILMIKANAILRLFSFGSFHVHSIFFNFLSFVGLIGVFRAFKSFFFCRKEWLIGVVFCLPSVLFWSSSVLKEGILLLLIGVLCFQLMTLKKKEELNLKSLSLILVVIFFLSLLKFYVVAAIAVPLVAFLISLLTQTKKVLFIYLGTLFCFSLLFFNSSLVNVLVLKQQDFLDLVSNTKAASSYEITSLKPDVFSVLKAVPNGVLNCFVRPFPSSSLSIMAIPAIIENIIILLGIGFITPQLLKRKNWKAEHLNGLLFMLFFIFILFAIIGITTPVAGALVRYKVAALPFLGIVILYFYQPKLNK
jgi:hypothetical protein